MWPPRIWSVRLPCDLLWSHGSLTSQWHCASTMCGCVHGSQPVSVERICYGAWGELQLLPQRSAHFAADKTGFSLVYFLTICSAFLMQCVSWEGSSSSSASRRIPSFCGTRVHCTPPPVPVLSQINSFHAFTRPYSWISILILSFHLHLGFQIGLFSSGFPHQNPLCTFCPTCAPCRAHFIFLDFVTQVIFEHSLPTSFFFFGFFRVHGHAFDYFFPWTTDQLKHIWRTPQVSASSVASIFFSIT